MNQPSNLPPGVSGFNDYTNPGPTLVDQFDESPAAPRVSDQVEFTFELVAYLEALAQWAYERGYRTALQHEHRAMMERGE